MQNVLFVNQKPRRERTLTTCGTCKRTTEHVKEPGEQAFKCTDCEHRRKLEAAKQQASGI